MPLEKTPIGVAWAQSNREQARIEAGIRHYEACCDSMALLLSREFGLKISSAAVAKLFREYWSRISMLAHGIHGNMPPTPQQSDFWSQKDLYDIL